MAYKSYLDHSAMEINQVRRQRPFILYLLYGKGFSHHHRCLGKTQRQGEEWKGFIMEKGMASSMPRLEAVGTGKL